MYIISYIHNNDIKDYIIRNNVHSKLYLQHYLISPIILILFILIDPSYLAFKYKSRLDINIIYYNGILLNDITIIKVFHYCYIN